VLLVDADLRKPALHLLFETEITKNVGLPLLLTGKMNLEKMLVSSSFENLWLLPNNVIPPNPAELLGSESMKKVIDEMKRGFDYVVFDGAPILPVTDSVLLSTSLDGVLFLARFNQTRRAEVRQAFKRLDAVKAPLLGTVLNGVDVRKGLL
jgi:receptor protein-tyrosine kinase